MLLSKKAAAEVSEKLRKLQQEEKQLNKILTSIRTEINKLQVERMHFSNEETYQMETDTGRKESESSDSDDMELLNAKKLALDIKINNTEEVESESD